MARFQKNDREAAVLIMPIVSMVIFLLMASLLASTIIGVDTGVEELFVKDSMAAVQSVVPGRPSIATMLNFILIAMTGVLTTMNIAKLSKMVLIFGMTVAAIGITAILGYLIDQPLLYFSVLGKSSAMAVNTAILFILWGIGSAMTERNK